MISGRSTCTKDRLHLVVTMDTGIQNGLADIDQIDLNLVLGPVQSFREKVKAPRLESVDVILRVESSKHLELRVFGPAIDGQLEDFFMNVNESSFLVPPLQLVSDAQGLADLHGSSVLSLGPHGKRIVRWHRSVITVHGWHDFLRLHPSTGLQRAIALGDDYSKVFEGAEEKASMDIILWGQHPVVFVRIVDHEFAILRDPARSGTLDQELLQSTYHLGWLGDKSVPTT